MQAGAQAMTDETFGTFELPEENNRDEKQLEANGQSEIGAKPRLRVVVPQAFEPAEAVSPEAMGAFLNRFSLLFVNEESARRGGVGTVYFASNPFGEHLAVKVLNFDEAEAIDDSQYKLFKERAESLFAEEFECHKKVSGIKGFPRLFGCCGINDKPALVMEWIEGISLKDAQSILAINPEGAVSPLVAGRIGRDLFEVIARLSALDRTMAHRDLSPSNVMIRTSRVPLQEQIDEGAFDVCLIDFGSASRQSEQGTSFTQNTAFLRKATPDYAAPEMLEENPNEADLHLRNSVKIDVYAGASILFELVSGYVPFDLDKAMAEGVSFYQLKCRETPRGILMPHATRESFLHSVSCEPELAVALELDGFDLGNPDQNLVESVDFVDRQLVDLLGACILADQAKRPNPEEVWGALRSFCAHYYRNIQLSYEGEPLIPCMVDGEPKADADLMIEIRDAIRSVTKSISYAVLAVVLFSAGLLTAGTWVSFNLFGFSWDGALSGFDTAFLLAFPAVLGFALGGWRKRSAASFARGTGGVLVGAALAAACISGVKGATQGFQFALFAALAASSFAAWCPIVAEFALSAIAPMIRRIKRNALPGAEKLQNTLREGPSSSLPESSL